VNQRVPGRGGSTLARISSAVFVYTNGLGFSFAIAMYCMIAASKALVLR
jgi:hypothetical protein